MTINSTFGKWEVITAGENGRLTFEHVVTNERVTLNRDGSISSPGFNGVERIRSVDDLPEPVDGAHQLEAMTPYWFDSFVTSEYPLELGAVSPLLASHGGSGGFIYTGGEGAALRGSGVPFFARDMYFGAPGATMFDLSADATTEMLVESASFADALGYGNIASLGTISGFRVPSFKGCNFEDFDAGLRFDGNPDKIFIESSPLRDVDAAGVTMLTLAGTCSVDIVDFAGNYVKDVQPDTEVWHVEAGGEPNEVFQYRGTTHNPTVAKENILTGPNAGAQVEPFWVTASYPLRNSGAIGELSLQEPVTVTTATQGEWYEIGGNTVEGNETERVVQSAPGVLQYTGSKDTNVKVTASTSFTGANGDVYRIGIAKNGTLEPASTMETAAGGQNAPVFLGTSASEDITTGDTLSIVVSNTSGVNDPTFRSYVLEFQA